MLLCFIAVQKQALKQINKTKRGGGGGPASPNPETQGHLITGSSCHPSAPSPRLAPSTATPKHPSMSTPPPHTHTHTPTPTPDLCEVRLKIWPKPRLHHNAESKGPDVKFASLLLCVSLEPPLGGGGGALGLAATARSPVISEGGELRNGRSGASASGGGGGGVAVQTPLHGSLFFRSALFFRERKDPLHRAHGGSSCCQTASLRPSEALSKHWRRTPVHLTFAR